MIFILICFRTELLYHQLSNQVKPPAITGMAKCPTSSFILYITFPTPTVNKVKKKIKCNLTIFCKVLYTYHFTFTC